MDLREWLESRAGLSGKKLLDALQQCAEKSCESMEDLRFMHSKGKLENILSNGLLMMRVEEALDNEPDPDVQDTSALPSTKRTVPYGMTLVWYMFVLWCLYLLLGVDN